MSETSVQTEMEVEPPVVTEVAKPAPKAKAPTKAKTKRKVQAKSKSKVAGAKTMSTKSSAFKKFEASFEPAMEYNKMIADSMESSYNMAMDSFQGYAKLGIDSMQSGLKVRSPADMMSFFEEQQSMAQKASDMMMSDAKSASDMGVKFFNDMRSLYESGMKTSMSAATEAMKA
jgi:phasin family protein